MLDGLSAWPRSNYLCESSYLKTLISSHHLFSLDNSESAPGYHQAKYFIAGQRSYDIFYSLVNNKVAACSHYLMAALAYISNVLRWRSCGQEPLRSVAGQMGPLFGFVLWVQV
jgi:hypothetical protein